MSDNSSSVRPHIFRISIAPQKGQKKRNVRQAHLIAGGGIAGDGHADTQRPVSLLPYESFGKLEHPDLKIMPGMFAENLTTRGVDFKKIQMGTRILLGDSIELEVIQLGKRCHNGCIIRETVGDCIMPREGVFASIIAGGYLNEGDSIRVLA